MGKDEIEAYLSHLATNRNVSASTQNQAFNALLFLYREVLGMEMDMDIRAARARTSQRLPVILGRRQILLIISGLQGAC
jgi:hypothetical protein